MSSQVEHEVFLVAGGSGLLGRHIVEALKNRGEQVVVLDIVQRYDDVPFFQADVANAEQVLTAFQKSGATAVFHCVSPQGSLVRGSEFWQVNVIGTQNIIDAALACGVRRLVYTSSSGIVFTGSDLNGIDETYPYPKPSLLVPYAQSKMAAERAVIEANGKRGLCTVALRPSGIFGPGDRQLFGGLATIYLRGRSGVQIGHNENLADWTYVTNVAQAHILAVDKLASESHSQVAGEIFFITNDEPWPFWDFANAVWDRLDQIYPGKRVKKKPFIIPRLMGLMMGAVSEFIGWITRKPPTFTRYSVTFSCTARWHNIEKAKNILGYKPTVGMAEGINLASKWWETEMAEKSGSLKNA